MFSWQEEDYRKLNNILGKVCKIAIVHSRDYASPYHVLSSFYANASKQENICIRICTDITRPSYPLLPFSQAVEELNGNAPSIKPLLPALAKDITHSDTLASLVGHIVSNRQSAFRLNERENEILIRLERATVGYIPVFFLYGFSYFDSNSKRLALLMISGTLDFDFPFLQKAKYIFLEEDGSEESLQQVKVYEHLDVVLGEPKEENMAEIMLELAPGLKLTTAECKKLFHLSGGRMSVMEIIVQYLCSKGTSLEDKGMQDIIDATLSGRIAEMGREGMEVQAVLEVAADIGNTFSISLLKRVSGETECGIALNKSSREHITESGQSDGRFLYKEIWQYFFGIQNSDRRRKVSHSIERAVYFFNPYDYYTRAQYMERAGFSKDACELYLMAYNQFFHEGMAPDEDLTLRINKLSVDCGLTKLWRSLLLYYDYVYELDFKHAALVLHELDTPFTTRTLLLKEYLTAIALHRSENAEDIQEAIITMRAAADHAYNIEEGFWCDCQTSLISFIINSGGNRGEAQKIYKELIYYYTNKSYAPYAQKGLHALERKCGALYSVEKSVVSTEKSVSFFRNKQYPSQHLMALNNHAANLIVLGRYDEAIQHLEEAVAMLMIYKNNSVNRMYLLNNLCLGAVLSGRMPPEKARQSLLQTAEDKSFGDWSIIYRLNCAIYSALSGNLATAENELCELKTISEQLGDDYYVFYVYANLAALSYLKGNHADAIRLLAEKCTQAPKLFKETERYYIEERTKQWIRTMQSIQIQSPKKFDTYILDVHPRETEWAFHGRGFLYSDLQFWTEP